MTFSIKTFFSRLSKSQLARDSLWAVCGNGLGYGLLLLSGIVIARFLGRDLYGEYGLVKTTMLYIAGFATFGLGVSSTKFIANALVSEPRNIRAIAQEAMRITLAFSAALAAAMFLAAEPLSAFLGTPSLSQAFRVLGLIIVCKALNTTQNGILAGFGCFSLIARNNVISGALMLLSCAPLTWGFGLDGAFASLLASQALNVILNHVNIRKKLRSLKDQRSYRCRKKLIAFSFPIAVQELNYTLCNWGAVILLTKFSSVGQVGIYTATSQWIGIITFIPVLLNNVILSHLSASVGNRDRHSHTLRTMLGVNLISTLVPFAVISLLAGWIAGFYGPTFKEMGGVLRVMTIATIFISCSNVFYSELIARGLNWLLFGCRVAQDAVLLLLSWWLLTSDGAIQGAMAYAIAFDVAAAVFPISLWLSSSLQKTDSAHACC